MELTHDVLIASGLSDMRASEFLEPLRAAFARFGINTRRRIAGFLAQAAHESRDFEHLQERLSYSDPQRIIDVFGRARVGGGLEEATQLVHNPEKLANRVYANRYGNGDEASGDGWAYSGKGPLQLTWKDNYRIASDSLGVDYVGHPEFVMLPFHGAMTSVHYFAWRGCLPTADAGDIEAMTVIINGPRRLGLIQRIARFDRILREVVA
jgi:putative chitinase